MVFSFVSYYHQELERLGRGFCQAISIQLGHGSKSDLVARNVSDCQGNL